MNLISILFAVKIYLYCFESSTKNLLRLIMYKEHQYVNKFIIMIYFAMWL